MLTFADVGWGTGATRILHGVDLEVAAGELAVLVGRSGSGKSTLLRLAAGLIAPTGGAVTNRAHRCAIVFQDPRLLPWETALDNAGLPLEADGLGRRQARAQAALWLRRLGLGADDVEKRPNQLSGGMRARVAIARAFVTAPDLVLLDEPFAALDLGLRRDLQALTRGLVEETGVAALFVTHDLTEAVCLADRILVLSGQPARVTAAVAQVRAATLAEVWQAAAALSRRPEIAAALGGSGDAASRRRPHAT